MKKTLLFFILLFPFIVSAQHGIVSVVAGGGTYGGFGGDGGAATATAARFNTPTGVTMDTAGNLYIFDKNNNRVRRVDHSTGILTTIAGNGSSTYSGDGGPATAAGIVSSGSRSTLCTDRAGNIYLTDDSKRIRKIDISSGIISTVAGNGSSTISGDGGAATSAGLGQPTSVYVDTNGNIFISGSYKIRKVTASTGIISAVAGSTSPGFAGDGGPATAARLDGIRAIVVDNSGNIYCTDNGNNRVRKISASGVITTIAGNGTMGNSGDGGPATVAQLYMPKGMGIDPSGNIYVHDYNYVIRKIDASTGIINKVAGMYSSGSWSTTNADSMSIDAECIYSDPAGNIYYTYLGGWTSIILHPFSVINRLSATDSLATATCTLPATVNIGIHGTVNGTPSSTDSVHLTVNWGEFTPNPVTTYTLPYTYSGSTYGFGDTISNLGSYTYHVPGVYTPTITVATLGGYTDVINAPTVTIGNICGSGITALTTDSVQYDITSGYCSNPARITHTIWGRVTGTPSAGDSVYIVLNNDHAGLPYEMHKVPYTLSGSTYYFHDTISHLYPYGVYRQYVRAVTSSGLFSRETYAPEMPNSCSGGSISVYFSDTASAPMYCHLPFTDRFSLSGSLYDSAVLATTVSVTVNYGDGTISTFTLPVIHTSGGSFTFNAGTLLHTYTMSGSFTPTVTVTALSYTSSMSVGTFILGSSCSPVTGIFYIDTNADCTHQPMESKLGYWPYAIINPALSDTVYGWCNDTGYFSANVVDGYSYTIIADPAAYFTGTSTATTLAASCPSTGTFSFTASGGSYVQNMGFTCTSPSTVDMYTSGTGDRFRPGDTALLAITASNPYGYMCDTLSATVTLTLDTILNYAGISSGPAPTSVSGNVITWHFANVASLFEFNAVVKGMVHTTATASDTVRNTVSVTATRITDPDMSNNTTYWQRGV
ncbi:MAG: hypothetical protein H7257_08750, partial [Taibaiella sp.]|nr:hypothetical protein [Taibaiella sp.]